MKSLTLQSQSGPPSVKQLVRIDEGNSGSSRRIASALPSLWSGHSFQFNLQSLLYLDGNGNRLQQILMLIAYLRWSETNAAAIC